MNSALTGKIRVYFGMCHHSSMDSYYTHWRRCGSLVRWSRRSIRIGMNVSWKHTFHFVHKDCWSNDRPLYSDHLSSPRGKCKCSWIETATSKFRHSGKGCWCMGCWKRQFHRMKLGSRWDKYTWKWVLGSVTSRRSRCHRSGIFGLPYCKGSDIGSILR